MAQTLASKFDWCVEKPYYKWKTPLVVGGTRTLVLIDAQAKDKFFGVLNVFLIAYKLDN